MVYRSLKLLTLAQVVMGCWGVFSVPVAASCTTFASFNGESNSLLLAKNRDNRPDHQIIEVVATPGKFKYLALSRQDVHDFVSAGINEKNLAVFNEVTIEYVAQAHGGIADDFSRDILQNYTSAAAVIADLPKLVAKFPDPVFYQVADSQELLSIEVAPQHKYRYKLVKRGVFAHTNNYQESQLIAGYSYSSTEDQLVSGSKVRLQRATDLSAGAHNLQQMQQIALDHSAGTTDSIYRLGALPEPRSSKSLAFFGVQLTPHENSRVVVNLYTVGEQYSYILTPKFWDTYTAAYTVLVANGK